MSLFGVILVCIFPHLDWISIWNRAKLWINGSHNSLNILLKKSSHQIVTTPIVSLNNIFPSIKYFWVFVENKKHCNFNQFKGRIFQKSFLYSLISKLSTVKKKWCHKDTYLRIYSNKDSTKLRGYFFTNFNSWLTPRWLFYSI